MRLYIIILILVVVACVDPYNPPEIRQSTPILIVDGFINSNADSKLTLSWSQNIGDTNEPQVEAFALVWLQDLFGNSYHLPGDNQGNYYLQAQPLTSPIYRLHIETGNSKRYQSDFEPVLQTPPIDSVTWKLTDSGGVAFSVSTHDDISAEGFYKWTYEETWEYRSAYAASIQFDEATGQVVPRTDNIFQCWQTQTSPGILIESTTRLQKNQVSEFQLTSFSQNSERAKHRYSILVKQQAITRNAFNYWKQVRQTTEDLGTLFGPLPNQVIGNIKCISNPNEIAVGYFSIGSISSKRAFVSATQLPIPPRYYTRYDACENSEISPGQVSTINGIYLLIDPVYIGNGPMISAYRYGSYFCVDCRYAGGTTTKPDFW
ncbi:MAG: hypothetical protein UZ12_BCD005000914 [Bacteroidetes bacterium OLB12]|nr:MAG: hypothetical protein UZ12_BCD005000914 [Bacteroidetes bacterium OLB12]HNR73147.1 DUF4249 domain-containing protein [Cyclobacteriaceae bacterium]HNU42654.1 DUF4249 domain-containing protein [Cyclobacteriaceae bacterium]